MVHRVDAKVAQLYVDEGHCYITLKGIPNPPKDSLFDLPKSHTNYNALYSLALAAAVNGYTLGIRTREEIEAHPDAYPQVVYLVVDW
jgi:hypothetical protein